VIFADKALLFTNFRDVVITGLTDDSPSITVLRDNRPLVDLGDKPMCFDSFLRLDDRHDIPGVDDRHNIQGECCVHATPIDRTENASALQ
jgi:hypothetical protein